MAEESKRESIRNAGYSAWRGTVLIGIGLVVLVMFVGMSYLVYLGRMSDGPLVLFVGVVLGFLLRSAMKFF
ncbi:hypothetical protein [Natronomonas gomsonensis]|uniref:hypothetical protein n=1 Tax=Natronomonas gomsonensis TaxID=1046043 RepID=UPI0015BFBAAB|nr:hypothetical protein [Natronomonas gomsonensis]